MKKNRKVSILFVGPNRKSRGGISSLISIYMKLLSNSIYSPSWLETQDDMSTNRKLISFIKAIISAPIEIYKNNIIHIHTASNNSFFRKSFFIVLSKLLNRKIVLHIHGGGFAQFLTIAYKNQIKKKIIRRLLQMPNIIICLSESKANEVESYVSKKKIKIVPNPAPYHNSTKNKPIDNINPIIILFAGWVEKEKGIFDLISAFSEVQKTFINCRLIIAGKGRIDDGKKLAKKLHSTDKIIFTGWLQKNDMHKMLYSADIFCLPSYCEGVPMSILEAMALGLPVITTPVGGIPDIVENGKTGLFFQPGNIKQLEEKLLMLLKNPSVSQKVGLNAKLFVEKNHSISITKYKLKKIYNELID